jgi:TatD DNase family protein
MAGMIDSHCHLDDSTFAFDREAVVERARAAGVVGFLVAGVGPETWDAQRALASGDVSVRWSAGVHPCVAARLAPRALDAALTSLPACFDGRAAASAVGETGLDTRFVGRETLPQQTRAFETQVELAVRLSVPLVLHLNGPGCHGRALALLRRAGPLARGGVVHGFSGSAESALAYVALGLSISFSGTVARSEARRVHAAAAAVPGTHLLVETDAPDLALPGAPRRNEPCALPAIVAALSALRGVDAALLATQTAANAAALFGPFEADSAS